MLFPSHWRNIFSTRHWNNDILSAFGRYQPAADDTAVPATISSPSVRAADKRFGYRRHKVPISSTLGVDFVAALPRFRFPIQPWLSVAHSLEKLISTRHWNNDILSAFGRYQPAADDIAVPATISSPSRARTGGTKCRKTSSPCRSYPTRAGNSIQWPASATCLGVGRKSEDRSLGEDGSIVDGQSSITFGGDEQRGPSEPSVFESRFLRRDRAGSV